jgi:uncharacterized membrane protein YdbT with pleckstrin-like domain
MPVIACPDCGRDVSTIATACPHCGRPSPAGTTPLASPASHPSEQTLWRGSPSPSLLAGQLFALLLMLFGIPLMTHFFASTMPDQSRTAGVVRFGWIATAGVVALMGTALVIGWIKLRSTTYTVTNQRVLIEQGVVTKTVDEIDLRYVDDSLFQQGLVDRILGIGNVTLISSDKTTPRYVLRSISDPRGVRELIRAQAYQNSQRQIFTRAT